jgi:basic amino acid/polyamine antiporter, APA family
MDTVERSSSVQKSEAAGGLFTRKASGLVREMGLTDALGINASAISLGGVIVVFISALATFQQADLTWPIIVGFFLLVPMTLVYGQLTAAMPRSGGDYIFVGRILHPALGAAVGFGLLILLAYGAGYSATFLGSVLLPAGLQAIGSAFGSSAISNASSAVSTNTGLFWTSLPIILFAGLIGLRGVRALAKWNLIFVVIGTFSAAAWIVTLLIHDHASFIAAFNAAASKPDAYNAVIQAAHAGGWSTGSTLGGAIAVLPWAMSLYFGYTYIVYPAGEVKSAGRTVFRSTVIALAVFGVVFLAAWLGLIHLVGLDFAQASGWLGQNNPTAASKITNLPLTPNGFAFLMMSDPVSKVLLGLLGVWTIALELMGVLIVSRMLFALAFDRLLPTAITFVSPRSNSPVVAVAVAMVLMILALLAGIYTGFSTAFRNGFLIFFVVEILSCIAAILLPWLKPDLYAAAPKPFGTKWLGLPPVTIAGAVALVVWAVLFYLSATSPSQAYDWVSITTLAIAAFGGLILYGISTLMLRRRGTDLSLAMRELPPE